MRKSISQKSAKYSASTSNDNASEAISMISIHTFNRTFHFSLLQAFISLILLQLQNCSPQWLRLWRWWKRLVPLQLSSSIWLVGQWSRYILSLRSVLLTIVPGSRYTSRTQSTVGTLLYTYSVTCTSTLVAVM